MPGAVKRFVLEFGDVVAVLSWILVDRGILELDKWDIY
jgi:hypothetical protein